MANTVPNVHYPVVVAKSKTTTEQPEKENINTDLRPQSLLPLLIILIIVLITTVVFRDKD